jgi:hypothetical protein
VNVVERAQRLADEVLFPAALTTDVADVVPVELLDELAAAGLYGLSGPGWAGGDDADFGSVCASVEALASGCLTTAFVWVQHVGAVHAASSSENEAMRDWLLPRRATGRARARRRLARAVPARRPRDAGRLEARRQLAVRVRLGPHRRRPHGRTHRGRSPRLGARRRAGEPDLLGRAARAECHRDREGRLPPSSAPRRPGHVGLAVSRGARPAGGAADPRLACARRRGALLPAARRDAAGRRACPLPHRARPTRPGDERGLAWFGRRAGPARGGGAAGDDGE